MTATEVRDPTAERLVEAMLSGRLRAATEVIDDAMRTRSVAELYLEVVTPAMWAVGELWADARITVADEHRATQVAQGLIAGLAHRIEPEPSILGEGRALVTCTPGERHELPARMVADFLQAHGWETSLLGARSSPDEIARAARHADLVALSTTLPASLLAATRLCSRLRHADPAPFIVAGGQAYAGDVARARAAGADALAEDPHALLHLLRERRG